VGGNGRLPRPCALVCNSFVPFRFQDYHFNVRERMRRTVPMVCVALRCRCYKLLQSWRRCVSWTRLLFSLVGSVWFRDLAYSVMSTQYCCSARGCLSKSSRDHQSRPLPSVESSPWVLTSTQFSVSKMWPQNLNSDAPHSQFYKISRDSEGVVNTN
jgi:hypothetical protein